MSGLEAFASWIGLACIAASLCGAAYACLATLAVRSFVARKPLDIDVFPSVTLMKPLHGDEPELYDNLRSFCIQDYPGAVRMVLGVQDPDDPAIGVVRRLQQAHPGADIVLTIGAPATGGNRKIANLTHMATHATGDVLVISDSDVRVPKDHLRQVVAALQQPEIGLVTILYRGQPKGSVWSTLAAMDINFRFIPSVVIGLALGIAYPCLGPTMALRRDLMAQIGGFEYLSEFLADDYELGRAVRRRGYKVAFARGMIEHSCPEHNAREMLAHEFRWARTVRMIEPVGYFGSFVTHFVPLALIGAMLSGFTGWSLPILGLVALLRLVLAERLSRYTETDRTGLLLAPFRDLLSFGVFVAAFFGDRVEWRGVRLRVGRTGEITICEG